METARLQSFAALVEKWSAKINLVSRHDLPHLWARHVEDSLLLVPYIPAGITRAIDLGSGAGFPGMILAIETGIEFTLIESDTRKAAFLMEAARETGAKVKVLNTRIETAKTEPAKLVTAPRSPRWTGCWAWLCRIWRPTGCACSERPNRRS